jgi:hypothetical protein
MERRDDLCPPPDAEEQEELLQQGQVREGKDEIAQDWRNMPKSTPESKRMRCSYLLYRGRNLGSKCPRNGYHRWTDGMMYCLNHYRILNYRLEQTGNKRTADPPSDTEAPAPPPKRQRAASPPVQEDPADDEDPTEMPQEEWDPPPEPEPPKPEEDPRPPSPEKESSISKYSQDRIYKEALKQAYKQKYKAKYAKGVKGGKETAKKSNLWDFKKRNPRKNLNRAMKLGGGVSPLFRLPKE